MLDVSHLISARVEGLSEYAPEPLSVLAKRLGRSVAELIKLDANENPFGPTDHTRQVMAAFDEYHRYPDALSRDLRKAIGAFAGVNSANVLVGNGSDELLDVIHKMFRPTGAVGGVSEVIDCPPTFGMYSFYAAANDMRVVSVPRRDNFQVDVGAIADLCAADPIPRLLFVASPNNPDGSLLAESGLRTLLDLPLFVVLDEAYVEFSGNSYAPWVAERENLAVLRTFSKWGGLAGLRVGYGVFPDALLTGLYRVKSPYNVNCAAQAAALATLQSAGQANERAQRLIAERETLQEALAACPFLTPYPSVTNYILCRVSIPQERLRAGMEAHGIIIRYYSSERLADCVRISVGTPEENAAVAAALADIVAQEEESDG